jgi:hypothetical protein
MFSQSGHCALDEWFAASRARRHGGCDSDGPANRGRTAVGALNGTSARAASRAGSFFA